MARWLLKSEPSAYSWDRLVAEGQTNWDGVRNAQALNNMRAMKPGERAFFYHSNEGKDIVGIAEILTGFYPDPKDKTGKLGMVDVNGNATTALLISYRGFDPPYYRGDLVGVRCARAP